jgi:hypothetical protein
MRHALQRGVRMVALGPPRVRAVTRLDVSADDMETAIAAVPSMQAS